MKVVPVLAGCLFGVLCFAPLRETPAAAADTAQKKPGAGAKNAPDALSNQIMMFPSKAARSRHIAEALGREFDFGPLLELPNVRLRDLLRILEDNIVKKAKRGFRFYVDIGAFGTSEEDGSTILEAEVSFLNAPRRMSLRSAIEYALGQLPKKNATFIVRRGFLEITTKERLEPKVLFNQLVTFGDQAGAPSGYPLRQVLEDLSDQTGVAIVVDPKAVEKTKRAVKLDFRHNVSLNTAIDLLMRMSELKAIKVGRAIYVTLLEERAAVKEQGGENKSKPGSR